MASSYALPASAMTHSHHGHVHSHSHSPSRQSPYSANTPRSLKQERSNGSLHTHSQSESRLGHIQEHTHSHSHEREASPYPPSPISKPAPIPSPDQFLEQPLGLYEPPLNNFNVNVLPYDHHEHDHDHHKQHTHTKVASVEPRSKFTKFLLPLVLHWPVLHIILADKDSRRIFYFMSLNFAFMLVQASYGFLTDSLGLLSDSIHMFFDCLALAIGLFASISSKWPPSERFPYGFGKIESLSGFGNSVFLMLISIEITSEAAERIFDGRETKHLTELFVVSSLGLAVNLVGMACFGHHGHAGHDHGSHSHSHSPQHAHSHSHEEGHHHHDHDHSHSDHSQFLNEKPTAAAHSDGGHSHSHNNDNMHGIWLHVLADTMGSAAVIVSTILIWLTGWNGWDPVASIIIAALIFLSAIPLVQSSAKNLLLAVPDGVEYGLRDALGGVGELRGVASYSVPRFWMGNKNTDIKGEHVLGVIHIIATRGSDLEEVKERTRAHLSSHGMDVVVQVEKDGDTSCWCGGSFMRTPSRFS